jgi:excisionase family DNA binding protein
MNATAPILNPWLAPADLAREFGVSEKTIERLMADREIEVCKVGRQNRISREARDRFIERHLTPARRGGRPLLGELLAPENGEGRALREYIARTINAEMHRARIAEAT